MPENRVNNIDALRLVAALTVLFAHCFVLARPGSGDPVTNALHEVLPLQRGLPGQGVALFFVISGFLVTRSLVRRRDIRAYAAARALRIFPALWCALLVTIAVGAVVSTLAPLDFLGRQTTAGYVAHNGSLLGMRYELAGVFGGNPISSVNLSLWTLPLEFLMYLVVAALGILGAIRSRFAFNAFVVLAFATFVLADGRLPIVHDHHDSELLLFFVAGAAVYVNFAHLTLRGPIAAACLAAAIGLSPIARPIADVVVILAFAYAVLWLGLSDRVRLPNLAARGDLSYATYLYAALVTQVWISAIGAVSPWLLVALTVATTLPLAWLSWHLVEQPALRQKARVQSGLSRLRRKPAPGAQSRAY